MSAHMAATQNLCQKLSLYLLNQPWPLNHIQDSTNWKHTRPRTGHHGDVGSVTWPLFSESTEIRWRAENVHSTSFEPKSCSNKNKWNQIRMVAEKWNVLRAIAVMASFCMNLNLLQIMMILQKLPVQLDSIGIHKNSSISACCSPDFSRTSFAN